VGNAKNIAAKKESDSTKKTAHEDSKKTSNENKETAKDNSTETEHQGTGLFIYAKDVIVAPATWAKEKIFGTSEEEGQNANEQYAREMHEKILGD